MKFKIFAVYDAGAEAFLPPFFLPSIGQATRAFSDVVNDSSHSFSKHPLDYSLWILGSFDDATGIVDAESGKAKIIDAPAMRLS